MLEFISNLLENLSSDNFNLKFQAERRNLLGSKKELKNVVYITRGYDVLISSRSNDINYSGLEESA